MGCRLAGARTVRAPGRGIRLFPAACRRSVGLCARHAGGIVFGLFGEAKRPQSLRLDPAGLHLGGELRQSLVARPRRLICFLEPKIGPGLGRIPAVLDQFALPRFSINRCAIHTRSPRSREIQPGFRSVMLSNSEEYLGGPWRERSLGRRLRSGGLARGLGCSCAGKAVGSRP